MRPACRHIPGHGDLPHGGLVFNNVCHENYRMMMGIEEAVVFPNTLATNTHILGITYYRQTAMQLDELDVVLVSFAVGTARGDERVPAKKRLKTSRLSTLLHRSSSAKCVGRRDLISGRRRHRCSHRNFHGGPCLATHHLLGWKPSRTSFKRVPLCDP